MSDKKITTEELAKQVEEAKEVFDRLNEQLQRQQKEEEEKKQAKLALEKDARKKEVDEAWENYRTLLRAYIEDYGYFSITTNPSDWDSLFQKSLWSW